MTTSLSKAQKMNTLIVPIKPGSDGDSSHRPAGPSYRLVDPPSIYLEKLASAWVQRRGSTLQPGFRYMLDKLPAGYAVYEKPRPGNPKIIDKWCYGHPKRKAFDSPNRFLPHFLHLMDHGNAIGCSCSICTKPGRASRTEKKSTGGSAARPSVDVTHIRPDTLHSSSGVFRPKGRPWAEGRTDDEGSPDVYRNLIDKLKSEGTLDQPITETMSMDWRAEKKLIKEWFAKLSNQASWMPRAGELVLFVRNLKDDEEIKRDEESTLTKIWSRSQNRWLGPPRWEAGVVSQTPIEDVKVEDLVTETRKEYTVTYSGFRVEPLPSPNSKDKPYSKQYKYVRLNQIRPMALWSEMLRGTMKEEWHATVTHAHLGASTIALVDKYHFKGTWPTAKIFCRGMFIGAEFVQEGDLVRLLPLDNESKEVTDIMRITSITLDLSKLDTASNDDYDEGHPYKLAVRIRGKMFTLDKTRAEGPTTVDPELLPEVYDRFGKWFYRHNPSKSCVVPFHRVMGRCFELTALDAWIPNEDGPSKPPNFSEGLTGLKASRQYSTRQNSRIKNGKMGKTWFWADCRVEALDLHEVNGYEVASQDPDRDTKKWRKEIRILEGTARPDEKLALRASNTRRLSTGMNSMLESAMNLGASEAEGEPSENDRSRDQSRKRSRSALSNSSSEGEDARANGWLDQAIGLPMTDEMVSEDGEDDDGPEGELLHDHTPRGRRLEVVIE
jgi:hypothetical protein